MNITPEQYAEANELNFLEGKVVDLVTRYVDYSNGSLLLEEALEALQMLLKRQQADEDIDGQIPLWEEDYINNREDLIKHAK